MAEAAEATAPAPEIPALVQQARTFLKALKDVEIPEGYVRDTMPDAELRTTKGVSALLKALGNFIEARQELMSVDANKALVERLRGQDGVNLADMLVNIATNPPDLMVRKQEMRDALTISGQPLLDKLKLAIGNIAREKGLQLETNDAEILGEPDEKDRKRGPKDEEKDEGTWRESFHKGDKPPISDDEVRRAAKDGDKGGVDDAAITRSAQEGPKDFTPTDAHKSEYERGEDRVDTGYFGEQAGEMGEIRRYVALAKTLTQAFASTVEAPLMGRPGRGGPGGGG